MTKTAEDSIFTKIIKGEIPCYKIYEDEAVLAFLDIQPIQPGHILVVPKSQIEQFTELDKDTYLHLMEVSQKLANNLQEKTGCWRVCLRIEGFDVPHTHVHLVPTNSDNDSYNPKRYDTSTSSSELEKMAQLLKMGA